MNNKHKKYFDIDKGCLVHVSNEADNRFWDMHWQSQNRDHLLSNPPKHRRVIGLTRKFLPDGAKVLEGGCGLGDKVRALHLAGFDAIGLDYAEETLEWISNNWSELDVRKGDVRKLQFDGGSFDGYWSLGVIEHFYDGYQPILSEMHRVLKEGGYVFLTFPTMNWIRRHNAKKCRYEKLEDNSVEPEGFYQFALDPDKVIEEFHKQGFVLEERRGMGSLMGIEEEIPLFEPLTRIVKKIPFGFGAKINYLLDPLIGRLVGHTTLMVFRKE